MKSNLSPVKIIQLIPQHLLESLVTETGVDYQVSRLLGEKFFKLLLFGLLGSEKLSLRVLEELYNNSPEFNSISQKSPKDKTRHSSISDRINTINPDYFRRIFLAISELVHEADKKNVPYQIVKFDSTLVALSTKLLKKGLKGMGRGSKNKFIKYTLGLTTFPVAVKIFNNKSEMSEEIALRKIILESTLQTNSIVVFDRGIQRRETYAEFSTSDLWFVTRLKNKFNHKVIRENKKVIGRKTDSLILEKDLIIQLRQGDSKWIKPYFRLVVGRSLSTNEPIYFLTNITHLNAREITDIYKKRWEIEVFFKFLKQHLNLSHLLSRSENGMQVVLYTTLIAAMLVSIYKKANKISSYKIAKLRFKLELENDIIKEIVKLCGGDISRLGEHEILYPMRL